MSLARTSLGRPHVLVVVSVAALFAACSSQPSRRRAGDDTGGAGGEEEETGGKGGSAGRTGGVGGGGGAGGGGSSTQPDASVAAPKDAASSPDMGSAGDLDPDVPHSSIPGYGVCVVCHGPQGEGTPNGPEIQHPTADFATWVIRNGRMHPMYKEAMPKFLPTQVTDVQLMGILDFMTKLPKPTTGEGLYKDYCQNCHGADAKGGVTMRPIDVEPMNVFLRDARAGHHPGEFANRREYMPKWTAAELSDAEIRMIFMYVSSL